MKERLVGAAVLVAIAVWLVPWVLDGPEDALESSASSLQLPAAEEPMPMRTQTLRLGDPPESSVEPTRPAAASPTPEVAAVAEPPRGGPKTGADEQAAAEPAIAAALPEPEQPEPERPAPTPSTRVAEATPKASAPAPATPAAAGDWTVQLGSFGDEANARRVAQRAGTFGYKANVSSVRSNGKTLYRVRVGPQPTRAAADAAASALRAHGVDAQVVAAR